METQTLNWETKGLKENDVAKCTHNGTEYRIHCLDYDFTDSLAQYRGMYIVYNSRTTESLVNGRGFMEVRHTSDEDVLRKSFFKTEKIAKEKLEDWLCVIKRCSCDISKLMLQGCQCGGM